jgi:signal transduction histidine kinase
MKHPVRNWHPASLSGHESSDDERLACVSRLPGKRFFGAITPQFDILRSFSSQEAEERDPAHSVETNAVLAPQLTRLIDEAKKAAALAERSRIAHDVHDTLAQCLTGIYTQLEAASEIRRTSPGLADACIHKAKDLSHRGLQDVRRLVATLQPDSVESSGLAENLRKLAYESSSDASTKVLFSCKGAVRLVPPDIGHQLIQIAREAVGNALRYANAKSIHLKLGFTEVNIELSIEDAGAGFRPDNPATPKGFGLSTMRQRADRIEARFSLRTSPGTGTAIRILAPCPAWGHPL